VSERERETERGGGKSLSVDKLKPLRQKNILAKKKNLF
jgi:hypothetical protein